MSKIAFFDFDGTITTKDTLLEVIKAQKGKAAFYTGFIINAPVLIGFKLKLISNQVAKERMLKYFFGGDSISSFQQGCDAFIDRQLPLIIRPQALAEIEMLKAAGFKIVIVSASPQNWIKRWSDSMGLGLIATQLEVAGDRLTGFIKGKNCNAEEKVIRIKAEFDLSAYKEIYCYGDSNGDKAMLALATKAFYKPFRTVS
ncbi:HAD-IB family hydrolase [Mucilaginibacter sp.]|uniref:HAD-IB family hydrolase n=1 Tax=Mucilaginibacter sp. TaxID=1882438 RepID=UPI003D0A9FD3